MRSLYIIYISFRSIDFRKDTLDDYFFYTHMNCTGRYFLNSFIHFRIYFTVEHLHTYVRKKKLKGLNKIRNKCTFVIYWCASTYALLWLSIMITDQQRTIVDIISLFFGLIKIIIKKDVYCNKVFLKHLASLIKGSWDLHYFLLA